MKRVLENGADREEAEVRVPRVSARAGAGPRGGYRGGRPDDGARGQRDVHNVEMKAEIFAKKSMAGAVIGRGGDRVQSIRRNTGCQVHIRKGRSDEAEHVVELKGKKSQIEAALVEVQNVFAEVDPEYAREHPGISVASVQLKTLPEMVGCLIGRKGDRVRSIQESSGATVKVHKLVEGEKMQDVFIYGTLDEVDKAQELVTAALLSYDPDRSRNRRLEPVQRNTVMPEPLSGGRVMQQSTVLGGQTMLPGLAQTAVVAPAPAQPQMILQQTPGALAQQSTMLLLQADGTLMPIKVLNQGMPTAATTATLPGQTATITPQLIGQGGTTLLTQAPFGGLATSPSPAQTIVPMGTMGGAAGLGMGLAGGGPVDLVGQTVNQTGSGRKIPMTQGRL
ncbi:unnamed protein product [Ostreobium quekettii]|uniref:K Homology domain-containing protein n=1 Tax=Ostreobium quekettii TaxID=121088 RepID=A0A8S1JEB5_9CHLO|nr:unnamed protein product [Ostreobium quekettii]|eukprot:evm.model.scf_80EXC.2 EVM.evm.TU.scf_80EXC.2   scf_80EXC:17844-24476(-)